MAELVNESSAAFETTSRAFPAVAVGGLIVGTLDLAYAIVVYSPHKPILIPQTIASGVLGMQSYDMGISSAIMGVIFHFVIAFGAATVYYLASHKLNFMVEKAVISGLIYGALVYFFMHLVVLPLSAAPHRHAPFIYQAGEFVEHWFCVGLPSHSRFAIIRVEFRNSWVGRTRALFEIRNQNPRRQIKKK